jgi:hypothetical protein
MDTFLLEHRRAVLSVLVPINVVIGLGLIAVAVFGTILAITDPAGAGGKIGLPLWVLVPFTIWLVWFFLRWIRDMISTLNLYRESYQIDDLGISVTSLDGGHEFYGWQEITGASKPQGYLIRLVVKARARPLTLMSSKFFRGEKEFKELEELVRKRIQVPIRER